MLIKFRSRVGLILVLLVTAALALTACTSNNKSDNGSSGNSSQGGSGPKSGGILKYAIAEDPPHLNPLLTTDLGTGAAAPLWDSGLVYLDANYKPQPALATSWEISKDGKTYTFHLRQGVKWSDGQDFTADDVVFTLKNMLKYLPTAGQFAPLIADVTAPDPLTAVVTLKSPFAPMLVSLSDSVVYILPQHIYKDGDPTKNPANLKPVGTGPYVFDSWDHGKTITFKKNPNYWDKPKPYFDEVILVEIPNANTRTNALLSGEVDALASSNIPQTSLKQLIDAKNVRAIKTNDTPTMSLILMNQKSGPLANAEVRKALLMGIDRDRVKDAAFSGFFNTDTSAIPSGFPQFYDPKYDYAKLYPFDTQKAGQMLDDAGYPMKNGKRFTLRMYFNDAQPQGAAIADVMQANYKPLGIELKLQSLDFQVWTDKVYPQRDFDLAYVGYSSYNDPALGVQRIYKCEPNQKQIYTNPSSYCNPQLDELFVKAQTAQSVDDRAKYYDQVQKILADDLPSALVLGSGDTYWAFSKKIGGYEAQTAVGGTGRIDWAQSWFD